MAAPHGAGVLTVRHGSLQTGEREVLRRFARILGAVASELRSEGRQFEYLYVIELAPDLRPHAHFMQRGDRISSGRFRAALSRAGGQGDLQEIRYLRKVSRYTLKLATAGLDLPDVDAAAALDLHLSLNGEMLVHTSRRFWRDAEGVVLPGVRAARLAARSNPTGPAPTQEQLKAWRSGWALPPMSGASLVGSGTLSDAHPTPAEGQGWGDKVGR